MRSVSHPNIVSLKAYFYSHGDVKVEIKKEIPRRYIYTDMDSYQPTYATIER